MSRHMLFGQVVAIWASVSLWPLPSSSTEPPLGAARVNAHLDVGGDLLILNTEGQPQKVPLSVVAYLSYDEVFARRPQPQRPATTTAAVPVTTHSLRWYDRAEATIKIGEGGVTLSLPDERRLIVASATAKSAILCRPDGPLTREELDLIELPAGTHVLDRLMRAGSRRAGETWKHDADTMRLLLGLDEVTDSAVESHVIGRESGYVKLRLEGTLKGKTDGAFTELQVKAGYLFDTRLSRVTRLNLAFAEKREAGRIGPAVDVVGKLTLEIEPAASSHLSTKQLASLPIEPGTEQALLEVQDELTGLRLLHDREWYVTSHERERIVLRRVDDGEFLAQCNVIVRGEHHEGRRATMADFEREVRFSLGDRFASLVTASEWTNAAGLRCYRLVVHGQVNELPMEWRYYLASPTAGRSVALAFSVEPHLAEQLGDADVALVESIQFGSSESSKTDQKLKTSARSPAVNDRR